MVEAFPACVWVGRKVGMRAGVIHSPPSWTRHVHQTRVDAQDEGGETREPHAEADQHDRDKEQDRALVEIGQTLARREGRKNNGGLRLEGMGWG